MSQTNSMGLLPDDQSWEGFPPPTLNMPPNDDGKVLIIPNYETGTIQIEPYISKEPQIDFAMGISFAFLAAVLIYWLNRRT